MNFLNRLQHRWKLNSLFQVIVVLLVFALTGFTVMFLRKPVLAYLGVDVTNSWVYGTLYYIFILPIYNLILLMYGALFGQFHFFWEFEKKMFNRMTGRGKNDENTH